MGWGGAILGGIGSLLGGLIGSGASSRASDAYMRQLQAAQSYLGGQEKNATGYLSPWATSGGTAANTLGQLLGTPGEGLLQNWNQTFTAPTEAQAEATPGFQFQLKQGEDAIQNSAAGKGSLLTGRTLADLNNFAQGTASENYQNVFNNALTQYGTAYQSFLNNQNNNYAKLLGFSQQGEGAAAGQAGLTEQFGTNIADLMAKSGAVQAGGILGQANAWTGALGGAFSNLSNGLTLNNLMKIDTTPAYAEGTEFHPGGVAIVGEKGPELVRLPRGSKVIPSDRVSIPAWMIAARTPRTLHALA